MKPSIYTPFTSKPTMKQFNVKVLKVLDDYQNQSYFPTRREILMKVYGWSEETAKARRAQMSTIFANMVYHGLVKIDKDYRYHITDKGLDRLIEANQNIRTIFKNNGLQIREVLIDEVETAFKEYCHGTGCYYCKYANKNGELGCRGLFVIDYLIERGYIN